jgi:hypothetical protein
MHEPDLDLFWNIGLSDAATGGQTSTVGEPSLANNGRQILLTGNWYASRSLDNGASWDVLSPFSLFPPADGGFCCDQTAIYDPTRDLTFWLLQYCQQDGTNTLRLAMKQGATLGNSDWIWWDFRPEEVNAGWRGEWFDYNHAALSNNFLYVSSNVYGFEDEDWRRCVVFRLPLDDLAASSDFEYDYFQTTDNGSLRCTLGAREVMYLGSHNTDSELRVFSWREGEATVERVDVSVSPWREDTYSAPGPDGNDWLSRCDGRITGAWVTRGVIGFLWSANSIEGSRPFPYIRAVRLLERSKRLVDEPDLWSPRHAYAYPDACPNDLGQVAITLFKGGGQRHPGHVVGLWDDRSRLWVLQGTRNGTHGPGDGKWGDYLTCRRHSPDGLTWLAAGYTLQGGSTLEEIEPRVVHFGRREHGHAVRRWERA